MRKPKNGWLRPSDDQVDRMIVMAASWITVGVVTSVLLLMVCRVLVAAGVVR